MKKVSQMCRVLPPDHDMKIRTQELLEQFFETHYLPNEAERDILQRAGKVNRNVITRWCKSLILKVKYLSE